MRRMLVALMALLALATVGAHHGGGGGGGGRGWPWGRPRGCPNGVASMFPACADFLRSVQQAFRQNPGAMRQCSWRFNPNPAQCQFEQLMQARMLVPMEPSNECFDQVNGFLDGIPLNTTTTTTPIPPQPQM